MASDNIVTVIAKGIGSLVNGILTVLKYLINVLFLISDKIMILLSNLMNMLLDTMGSSAFPMNLLFLLIFLLRAATIILVLNLVFPLIFKDYMKSMFANTTATNKNTQIICQGIAKDSSGNVVLGPDKNTPLCGTVTLPGQSYITGEAATVTYNYATFNKANELCVQQMILWLIYLNIFVVFATFKST